MEIFYVNFMQVLKKQIYQLKRRTLNKKRGSRVKTFFKKSKHVCIKYNLKPSPNFKIRIQIRYSHASKLCIFNQEIELEIPT